MQRTTRNTQLMYPIKMKTTLTLKKQLPTLVLWLAAAVSYAQSGTIAWPTACPSNNCPTAYTDANGVTVNVSSTYGTGTGSAVNLVQMQGSTVGGLGITTTTSAASTTPGLGLRLDYGTNYTDAAAGNIIKISFDKALKGINMPLYDITSPALQCVMNSFGAAIYNDYVIVKGIGINGDTVNAVFTELARGGYNNGASPQQYISPVPAYFQNEQFFLSGNEAYTTGGYINNVANNQVNGTGQFATCLDITVSFSVPVKQVLVLYKNYVTAGPANYFSLTKLNNACPANINNTNNFQPGDLNPQVIMLGNLNYTGIVVNLSGTVYRDPNGMSNGVDGTRKSGVTVNLYDSAGTSLIATTTTDSSGNYRFDADANRQYTLVVVPPSGYSPVSSTDATPTNGKTSVSVASDPVSGIDFGLDEPPVPNNDSLNNQNHGTQATVPNILTNDSDPNGLPLSADSISLVTPPGAINPVVDAQGDTLGFTVPGQGTWLLNTGTGAVSFSPQTGFTADPTPIKYTVTDAAGLNSPQATISIDYQSPLPVVLNYFTAKKAGRYQVQLDWKVSMELNFDRYELEYSKDGQSFERIAIKKGSREDHHYRHVHMQKEEIGYYRLRMIDVDAHYTLSKVLKVNVLIEETLLVTPNPVSHTALVRGTKRGDQLLLYNAAGVLLQRLNGQAGVTEINMSTYTPGLYLLQVLSDNKISVQQKLIKE